MVLQRIPSWGRHQGNHHKGYTGYGLDGTCSGLETARRHQSKCRKMGIQHTITDNLQCADDPMHCSQWCIGGEAASQDGAATARIGVWYPAGLKKRHWLWNMLAPPWDHILFHHFLSSHVPHRSTCAASCPDAAWSPWLPLYNLQSCGDCRVYTGVLAFLYLYSPDPASYLLKANRGTAVVHCDLIYGWSSGKLIYVFGHNFNEKCLLYKASLL